MRKLLLGLISILLFCLAVYMMYNGISFQSFEINSIPAIQEENANLESKIEKAKKLKETDYPAKVKALESSYKKLITEKESYEQILALGVDENGETINKLQEYEIEKIWVTMGNYANKQGVDLKMDVTSNNSISKTYDLKFTVTGGYIQIIDFLYDIERDSTLVFKLENFKMVPESNTDTLVGTFTCRDIKINISETTGSTTTQTDSSETNNTTTSTKNNTTTNTNTTRATTSNSNTTE